MGRITKEQTRVRTEQARLASMYAQEIKRQEEIQQEEERLQVERQKFEEEKRNPQPQLQMMSQVNTLIRTSKQTPLKEETQAEILGLVKTNRETGQVEKTKDMDYEDYMNIINKVRITKEQTRVRTEQARLASMYAQEIKRQEEIQQEEERLQVERQKFEEEKRNPQPQLQMMSQVNTLLVQNESKSDTSIEKGQIDNTEQEQMKISPSTSSAAVLNKSHQEEHDMQPKASSNIEHVNNPVADISRETEEKRKLEEMVKREKEEEERQLIEAYRNEQIMQQKIREE